MLSRLIPDSNWNHRVNPYQSELERFFWNEINRYQFSNVEISFVIQTIVSNPVVGQFYVPLVERNGTRLSLKKKIHPRSFFDRELQEYFKQSTFETLFQIKFSPPISKKIDQVNYFSTSSSENISNTLLSFSTKIFTIIDWMTRKHFVRNTFQRTNSFSIFRLLYSQRHRGDLQFFKNNTVYSFKVNSSSHYWSLNFTIGYGVKNTQCLLRRRRLDTTENEKFRTRSYDKSPRIHSLWNSACTIS